MIISNRKTNLRNNLGDKDDMKNNPIQKDGLFYVCLRMFYNFLFTKVRK
ncbi:hypothetical protein Dip510_000753 [Elusimicrobium posterum]